MSVKGSGINKEDVRRARNILIEEGTENPTLDAVLKTVGRGSKSTIHSFMQEIKREEMAASQPLDMVSLMKPVVNSVADILTRVRDEAVSPLNEVIRELESDLGQIKTENSAMAEKIESAAAEIDSLRVSMMKSDGAKDFCSAKLVKVEDECRKVYGELKFIEGRMEASGDDADLCKFIKERMSGEILRSFFEQVETIKPDMSATGAPAAAAEDASEAKPGGQKHRSEARHRILA
jgi:chromosome segregation ATPase